MDDSFDVVISGIGGHFPECDDFETLTEKLHLGENLITLDDRRWPPGKLGVDAHTGNVCEFQYFDNEFFGIHRSLSTVTDVISRALFERVAECVFDAGLHPSELAGSQTSVYTSCTISENEATFFFSKKSAMSLAIVGNNRSMMANRISYFYDLKGRSCSYDSTWAWAALGLEMAYTAIKSGEVDAAILGGTSLCLIPDISALYSGMEFLSPDGKCRPFDADANGFTRADSQVVFFVQRSDRAKRAYAKVLGANMCFDGTWQRNILFPTPSAVANVVDRTFKERNIDKKKVKYVECYGSGYQPNDYAEVEGLRLALCEGRDGPLLIGSVKGNAGHAEAPSGMVSIVKAISILRSGIIPKTLNYVKPNPRIPSLVDGRIKVVNENMSIEVDNDTVLSSTSISYSGSIGHVALSAASRNKVPADPEKEMPRLILASGRTEDEVKRILTKISSVPFDPEYYRLVHDIFCKPIHSYNFRGHVICPSPPETPIKVQMGGEAGRPVWFVFSGMGSQWPQMGRDLLKISTFAATIERCHAILEPKGLDLKKIITHPNADVFDNILHCFVGITAIQIGLINIMRLLGIEPDGFIGHSVGEQACAYMDGCLNEEQTMLAGYARGMASNEAKLIKGLMAAVGIGFQDIKGELPESIDVACHNSPANCTISGPTDDVNEYVQNLTKRKIFVRTVNASNIAYHSRYIKDAGPILLRNLSETIGDPKERSKRWISTSVPRELWDTDDARFCSATYLTNNLLNAVLFEEAMEFLPEDVILIEIAPHGLLQAILHRSAPKGTTNISLTQRGSSDGLKVLYNAIAKMYLEGLSPKVSNLYPDVEFPVSRQTPSTADLATWHHCEQFYIPVDGVLEEDKFYCIMSINIETPSEMHRGIAVCSPTYYLHAVRGVLSAMRRFRITEMAFEFTELWYLNPVKTPCEGEKSLYISIQSGVRAFEVYGDEGLVISGKFATAQDKDAKKEMETKTGGKIEGERASVFKLHMPENAIKLSSNQVYSELASRGQTYKTELMAITSVEISQKIWVAKVSHKGDLDNVLAAAFQLVQLQQDESTQINSYPKFIQRVMLDPIEFLAAHPDESEIYLDIELGQVIGTGLKIIGLQFRPLQSEPDEELKLQASSLQFIPYGVRNVPTAGDILSLGIQLALENQSQPEIRVKILENKDGKNQFLRKVGETLSQLAMDHYNVELRTIKESIDNDEPNSKSARRRDIILTDLSTKHSKALSFLDNNPSVFIMVCLENDDEESFRNLSHLNVLAQHVGDKNKIFLLGSSIASQSASEIITLPLDKPIPELAKVSAGAVLVWPAMPSIGITAVIDAITKLPRGELVRMVFILDKDAPPFSLSHPVYRDQLSLGMRINILQRGIWGSMKTLPLPCEAHTIPNGRQSLLTAVSTPTADGTRISHWGLSRVTSSTWKTNEVGLDFCGEGPNGLVFGIARSVNGQVHLDPKFQWPVPKGWTPAQAASVPMAYCQAYFALCVSYYLVQPDPGNVLVIGPLEPEGQAAVRLALAEEKFGIVFAIARDEREHKLIEALFSSAVGHEKLRCIQSNNRSIPDAFHLYTKGGAKVSVIVTHRPEDIRSEFLALLSTMGIMFNLGGAVTATKKSIGMGRFLWGSGICFITFQSVLHMRDSDRRLVYEGIKNGLKPNGFIRPLLHTVRSTSSTLNSPLENVEAHNNKVVLRVKQSENPTYVFKTASSCLIAGGTRQQTNDLAIWSAKRGIKHIIVIQTETESTSLRRYADLLETVHGAKMQVFTELKEGLKESILAGSLAMIFVVAQDLQGERAAIELSVYRSTAPFVVFGSKGSDHGPLADSIHERQREVPHSLLLIGKTEDALQSRVMDWLLQNEKPPVITLLRCPAESRPQRIPAARLLKLLPQGPEALAALGKSFLPSSQSPYLVDVATSGPKHANAREVFPLFAVPGFAAPIDTILKPLAEKLLAPLIYTCLPEKISKVVDIAKEMAKLIRERQPVGPYSLLGFDWTAALTHQIACELKNTGNVVVQILLDGNVMDVEELALLTRQEDFENLLLAACLGAQINSTLCAELCTLPSWTQKLHYLASMSEDEESKIEIMRVVDAIRAWAYAFSSHEVAPGDAKTYLIRTSCPADVSYDKATNIRVLSCVASNKEALSVPLVQQYINDNLSHPLQQETKYRF